MQLAPGGTPYIRMIGMIVVFLGVVIGVLVFFRSCSNQIYLKIKIGIICQSITFRSDHGYRSFEYASLINSGLLVFLGYFFTRGYVFSWLSIFRVVF